MTKAQALAAINAAEGALMPASAVMTFPGGVETWTVQLDPTFVYTGAQLSAITAYCAANGLALSARFTSLGIA